MLKNYVLLPKNFFFIFHVLAEGAADVSLMSDICIKIKSWSKNTELRKSEEEAAIGVVL